MKTTVEYKGKQVTVDTPDAELEKLIAPRTGYERAENARYYTPNPFNKNQYSPDCDTAADEDDNAFSSAAYYTDERLARDNARADTLMRKLRRCAAEHGGLPSVEDWEGGKEKWYIVYNYPAANFETVICHTFRNLGCPCFVSKTVCETAIAEFHDELLWYFTEYEGQVRA